jgi:anaerobic selenocysteine-containing dehydrogenase
VSEIYNPPLQVVGFIGTRSGDEDRGPQIRLNAEEARFRLIMDGELVWIYGPRRHDLAPVVIDDAVPRGGVVVRDIAGLTVTEIVRLVKPNLDARPDRGAYA